MSTGRRCGLALFPTFCRIRILDAAIPLLVVFCVLGCSAQDGSTSLTDETSVPIPGAGHDYLQQLGETVNPANGSVSFRLKVPIPPGRGLAPKFSFGYDSNGVHFPKAGTNGAAVWTTNYMGTGFLWNQGGWSYIVPVLISERIQYPKSPPYSGTCTDQYGYAFQDADGVRHSFPKLLLSVTGGAGCNTSTLTDSDTSFQVALKPTTTVSDPDGTVYTSANLEDRNGNLLAATDTLGRTAITVSGFGTTGNTVTVSGLTNPYTLTWGTATSDFPSTWTDEDPGGHPPPWVCYPPTPGSSSQPVITDIQLPNRQHFKFAYDSTYGELNKITYPAGGWISYAWGLNPQSETFVWNAYDTQDHKTTENWGCGYRYDKPAILHRYVSFDGTTTALQQDFSYSTTWDTTITGHWDSKQTTVTTHDLVRGTQYTTVYTYQPLLQGGSSNFYWSVPSQIPLEQTITYNNTDGTLLKTVQKTWYNQYELASEQTSFNNGPSAQVTYTYGAGGQVTEKDEYDFGASAPIRKTVTNYESFGNIPTFPSGPSIFDRPCQIITYDGNGNRFAETDYFYDNGGTSTVCGPPGVASVTGVSNLTGHDETNYGPSSTAPRGNLTQKTQWSATGGSPVTTYTYDESGQILAKTDPCGNPAGACGDMSTGSHTTTYSYADSYTVLSGGVNVPYTPTSGNTNAFLTGITDGLGHSSTFAYDFNNSQLTKTTDQNSQNAGYIYNDLLARPTQANYPDGGQTEHAYNDAGPSPSVITCELISGTAGATCSSTSPPSGWKTSVAMMDGLGHVTQASLVSDPDGATYNATKYDGEGKPFLVYNPTRCNPPTTNCGTETTWGYTTKTYDALGRPTNVAEPDGSVVSTSYSGNQTTVTDEVGNQRTSQTDGLGRLTYVWEAPNKTGYNFETDYAYDPLNNLDSVNQKGGSSNSANWRTRSFLYDSLSRLTSATNPESGTITYTYDANSNLSSRVAPKPGQTGTLKVTTNYSYDVLNRLTQKAYVGMSAATPKYAYDGAMLTTGCGQDSPNITSTNSIGRRSAMCASDSGSAFSYDPMGRILLESRINTNIGEQPKHNVGYTYYLDGSLNTLTYPSGDVLTYTVGGAGRVTQLSDSSNNYVGYSGNPATYAPQGALAGMTNGHTSTFAGMVTSNIYNDRLQPILLSASVASSPIFSLCYDFHLGVAINSSPCNFSAQATGDNGNLFKVLNNVDSTRSAVYAYDPLNRVSQANTVNTSGANCWGEVYTIDPWGNLSNRSGVSGMGTCYTEGLSATPTTQNQLSGIGVLYDAAGNVTNDGSGNTPTYDPENRIATDAGVTYQYDADGARMEKSSGTKYWFGPGGEVLTETALDGTINEEYVYFNGDRIARIDRPSGILHYYFSNHLGSASVITDASGNIEQQTDYYPFGGVAYTSGTDTNHYKFTGKERDTESNFDNFGARYFTSAIGRFMTPDWAARPTAVPYAVFGDPQSLNLYVYVRNDPVTLADADGHQCSGPVQQIGQCPQPSSTEKEEVKKDKDQEMLAEKQSWWQKVLGYFYFKVPKGEGLEVKDVKIGLFKVSAGYRVQGKDFKQTTNGMTVTTVNSEVGVKVEVGPAKVGVQRTDKQEEGQPAKVDWLPGFEWGNASGSGGEVGVGAGACILLCGGAEVGVDAGKVLNDLRDATGNAVEKVLTQPISQ